MTSPWYKDIADHYHLSIDSLKMIRSSGEVTDGYCVLEREEKEYAYIYKDRVLIAEGDDFNVYRFLILRLFVDKYSTGKYALPKITNRRTVGQSEEEAINENYKIMEIMLRPLDTYEQLLDRLKEAEDELSLPIFGIETFDGHESQENGKKALNGKTPDYEDFAYRVIKSIEEGVWDIYSEVERGNGRLDFLMRIYGRRYLHEYILNNHLSAVG